MTRFLIWLIAGIVSLDGLVWLTVFFWLKPDEPGLWPVIYANLAVVATNLTGTVAIQLGALVYLIVKRL